MPHNAPINLATERHITSKHPPPASHPVALSLLSMEVLPLHIHLCSQALLEILWPQAWSGWDLVLNSDTSSP